jgi:hypothetical protein
MGVNLLTEKIGMLSKKRFLNESFQQDFLNILTQVSALQRKVIIKYSLYISITKYVCRNLIVGKAFVHWQLNNGGATYALFD